MLNEIKRKNVLKIIFEKLRMKKILNLLKYNKRLLDKLKININDYKDYLVLKQLNDKFSLNIDNTKIQSLDIGNNFLGNEILIYLNKIKFTNLKELNISRI